MKTLLKTAAQVVIFILLARLSDAIVKWLHLPVSGSIVGIIILFTLLQLKVIRMEWIELGSKWLLAEMLLFFIPAAVGITNYKSLVMHSGIFIFLSIFISTIAVMVFAGLIGERIAGKWGGEAQ
ncbi:CidA/LrgA family protein [Paenibacillus sp. PL91]|uniref:CidA/LrgA family protein n=1 Tax=Paenibacillus sp. PL91 TaxID=2729538 RepID=UPI00145DDD6D|nr:CidA/LrgA family holin-like protein [Paenibacillus sp. PL91]MBC9198899.1 CidA/LrgA family holin-like protein [Paenibacillus sp. PL91]